MAPSPLHLFEVWANEDCTERPIIGTEYSELFLQVNEELYEQCPTPEYASDMYGVIYLTCSEEIPYGTELSIQLFLDFRFKLGKTNGPGVDLTLKKGVYRCQASEPFEIIEMYNMSSGPIVS